MAYKDKYGITKILKGKYSNLSISWDYDDNEDDKKQRRPILLFVPNMDDSEHFHIELSRKQATALNDWLTDYLKDTK